MCYICDTLTHRRTDRLYKVGCNKLKSLKVAKSKDDDGGAVDGSVDVGDVNGVLKLCVMVHVIVYVIMYVMVCGMV